MKARAAASRKYELKCAIALNVKPVGDHSMRHFTVFVVYCILAVLVVHRFTFRFQVSCATLVYLHCAALSLTRLLCASRSRSAGTLLVVFYDVSIPRCAQWLRATPCDTVHKRFWGFRSCATIRYRA